MRLTLRTLLAYLDDRLPPAQAREIGQRITNSAFATELADRIREVKRRRRLAAPGKAQAGIDANLVAEYLDDQLTPDLVARVEREILASDALLAEVSSAHEILGLLREPITVEPRLRDRLYAFDPTGQTEVVRTLTHGHAPARAAATVSGWKPLPSASPSSGQRLGIVAGALALLWLVVTLTDSTLFSTPQRSQPGDGSDAVVNNAPVGNGVAEGAANAPAPDPAAAANEPGGDAAMAAAPASDASQPAGDGALVADAGQTPDGTAPDAPAADVTVPVGEPVAANEQPAVPVDPAAPVVDPAAPPIADPVAPSELRLSADSRSVLCFDAPLQRWVTLHQIPGGDLVTSVPNLTNVRPLLEEKWFGVPDSFRLALSAADSGWLLTVIGRGLLSVPAPDHGGLNLHDARALLKADKAVAWNPDHPPVFEFGTGALRTKITLETQDSWLAIEVVPSIAPPAVSENAAVEPSLLPSDADLHVRLMVIEGAAKIQVAGTDEPTTVTQGNTVTWTVVGMGGLSDFATIPGPVPAAMPAWVLQPEVADPATVAVLKERLLTALSGPGEPADAVLELLADRDPQAGVLAVQALAQMRDSERLLTVLFDPHDELIARATIDALSVIVNSSAASRKEIRVSMETRLPMAEVEFIMNLTAGLTPTQTASPVVTSELLNGLSSDRLLTRTLCIYRMEQAVGDRMSFHPAAEPSRRRDAVRRWKSHIDRNDGHL